MEAVLERTNELSDELQPPVKAPFTRLLDLLAGWEQYAQKDVAEGVSDAPHVLDAISDLYQEGGSLSISPSASRMQKEAIFRAFLTERVLPVLMHEAA